MTYAVNLCNDDGVVGQCFNCALHTIYNRTLLVLPRLVNDITWMNRDEAMTSRYMVSPAYRQWSFR